MAARANPEAIKSLDVIHIASAESLGANLDFIVTYDKTILSTPCLLHHRRISQVRESP